MDFYVYYDIVWKEEDLMIKNPDRLSFWEFVFLIIVVWSVGGALVFVENHTYTVFKTYPYGQIVKIVDPQGKEVEALPKDWSTRWDEVPVAPDYK